jgi:hypothetical protein
LTDASDLQRAAEGVSTEIGLDLSYFTDESERNFLHLALPIGYLLLQWFLEGCVSGVGEAAAEQGAREAAKRLGARVRRLFGGSATTPEADAANERELAAEAQTALTNARRALATIHDDERARVGDAYEQALVGYLTDNGMPARDATRIAQRVRAEARIQLRLSPQPDQG